jgi:pimeloyl-ACP methyl ester carboxylesterase
MNKPIHFEKAGKGKPLILLHGFPMNQKVWQEFSPLLSESFAVYTPDLPGFGKSPMSEGDFTLADVARRMNQWVEDQRLAGAVIIGHSMGGYVALEMVRQAPAQFSGLGLFHSTALPDNDEKKESRTKVVKFIDDNGVLAFTSNFIQPLFAEENHPAVSFVKDVTVEASKEAVQGYTKAMRDRRDNTDVLRNFKGEVLMIGGEKDKGIPADSLRSQSGLNNKTTLHIFPGVAHMGMFEKREETAAIVKAFLLKIYQPDRA